MQNWDKEGRREGSQWPQCYDGRGTHLEYIQISENFQSDWGKNLFFQNRFFHIMTWHMLVIRIQVFFLANWLLFLSLNESLFTVSDKHLIVDSIKPDTSKINQYPWDALKRPGWRNKHKAITTIHVGDFIMKEKYHMIIHEIEFPISKLHIKVTIQRNA